VGGGNELRCSDYNSGTNMKAILIYIVFQLLAVNSLTAQISVLVERNDNKIDYAPYYFYFQRALNESKKNTKAPVDTKDTLALFISDSINFHKWNRYIHLQHPHSCQNRFGKIGFINSEDQVVIPFEFDFIQDRYDSSFLAAKKKNQYGVIDSKGNTVMPFKFSQVVQIFNEKTPLFCLKNFDGKIGILDKELNPVIPFEFGAFNIIDSNMLALKKNEEDLFLSFYNKRGEPLFSLNGYKAKERAGKYISIASGYGSEGIVNKKGKWIVPPDTYASVSWIWDDLFCVPKNNHYGIINAKGKTMLPFEYSRISPTTNKQFIVYKNGMSGVVNLKNEFIIPLDSISIYNFGVLYFVRRHNSNIMGLINSKGERILSEKYSLLGGGIPFNSGQEGIEEIDPKSTIEIRDVTTRLSGMYRADGVRILPISYNYVFQRPENSPILIGKRSEPDTSKLQYAAVDINGKFITQFTDNVLSFLPDAPGVILSTNQDKKAAFINARTGDIVTAYEFDTDYQNKLKNGYIAAKKGWFYAIVLPDGKKLTEAVYRDVYMPTVKNKQWFDEEIVCVVKRNEILLGLTKTGKEILKVR
jgi:WG containing repeat